MTDQEQIDLIRRKVADGYVTWGPTELEDLRTVLRLWDAREARSTVFVLSVEEAYQYHEIVSVHSSHAKALAAAGAFMRAGQSWRRESGQQFLDAWTDGLRDLSITAYEVDRAEP
ncbi:MAG TPA: hypothetical protein VF491_17590 [Vicinamibacterales bacterium]